MAKKLKTDPIEQADLIEFLDEQSDFGFEIQVLRSLVSLGFECEHGGTYTDPATGKPRQFDIRARRKVGSQIIRLAVECKNLQAYAPLLISCIPRTDDESFHEVIQYDSLLSISQSLRCDKSIYGEGEFVGKATEQVGRRQHGGDFSSGDSEVYDKWAQSLASAQDLINAACAEIQGGEERREVWSFIVPVLVIPDETLWVAHFNENGECVLRAEKRVRCPCYIGRSYEGDKFGLYCVSHLEFVTISGLQELSDLLSVEQLVSPRN